VKTAVRLTVMAMLTGLGGIAVAQMVIARKGNTVGGIKLCHRGITAHRTARTGLPGMVYNTAEEVWRPSEDGKVMVSQ